MWTNTCCSHPLHGQRPDEVDSPADVAKGTTPGVKRAAVRKLLQELGVPARQVPIGKFKFLTRMHYWAADTVTWGPEAPWGEHEVDYILFIQADVTLKPNPEEVGGTKWVTWDELQADFEKPGLLWSPWFKIIANRWLKEWWADLSATIDDGAHDDFGSVHRFDPPVEHYGTFNLAPDRKAAVLKKQGGYGKVKTHKTSKLAQIVRFDEVVLALYYKALGSTKSRLSTAEDVSDDVRWCDKMLGKVRVPFFFVLSPNAALSAAHPTLLLSLKVSRSFSMVIRQLPDSLYLDVLIFYLVLRALDTVEDDMNLDNDLFKNDVANKVKALQDFYVVFLGDEACSVSGVGEGDEEHVLTKFGVVARVLNTLPAGSKSVIVDITKRMGAGMAEFVAKDLGQGSTTVAEYDRYVRGGCCRRCCCCCCDCDYYYY